MTAGARRLFAALAILMLPVGAAAEVRVSPSDAPGRERERFIEPLGNRLEPLVSSRFRTVGHRRPVDFVQSHIDVDEILNTLIFDLAFWSLNRRRRF